MSIFTLDVIQLSILWILNIYLKEKENHSIMRCVDRSNLLTPYTDLVLFSSTVETSASVAYIVCFSLVVI